MTRRAGLSGKVLCLSRTRFARPQPATAVPRLPALDPFFVARGLLGGLAAHEQRQLLVRLLRMDRVLRGQFVSFLTPFAVDTASLELSRLEAALETGVGIEVARASLLNTLATDDLEELIRTLSFEDFFQLGPLTRRFCSWSTAEYLLRRADRANLDLTTRRARYFLAALGIDSLEILTAAGVLSALSSGARRSAQSAAPIGKPAPGFRPKG